MTLDFVRYHLNFGVDLMYLYFDDPNDPALAALADEERVVLQPCDAAHWKHLGLAGTPLSIEQRLRANGKDALRKARARGADWLIHIDADELLHAEVPLVEVLAAVPARCEVLLLPLREAVPSRPDHRRPFREITGFKITGIKPRAWRRYRIRQASKPQWRKHRRRLRLARITRCPTIIDGEYFRGSIMPRAITRLATDAEVLPVSGPVATGRNRPKAQITNRAAVLHFDAYDFDAWHRKWEFRLDGTGRATALRPARRASKAEFDKAHALGDATQLEHLYRRWHMISSWESRVLRSLGLLRTIRIDPALFATPDRSGPEAMD